MGPPGLSLANARKPALCQVDVDRAPGPAGARLPCPGRGRHPEGRSGRACRSGGRIALGGVYGRARSLRVAPWQPGPLDGDPPRPPACQQRDHARGDPDRRTSASSRERSRRGRPGSLDRPRPRQPSDDDRAGGEGEQFRSGRPHARRRRPAGDRLCRSAENGADLPPAGHLQGERQPADASDHPQGLPEERPAPRRRARPCRRTPPRCRDLYLRRDRLGPDRPRRLGRAVPLLQPSGLPSGTGRGREPPLHSLVGLDAGVPAGRARGHRRPPELERNDTGHVDR